MVHFIMDDSEDDQWPSDAQHSICIIIITMCLLHVTSLN